METLSIKVRRAEWANLKALARKQKTTVTALIAQALERSSTEGNKGPTSCYELSRDLFEATDQLDASKTGTVR